MFPLIFETKWQEICLLFCNTLQEKIEYYFPVLLVEDYDWVRNPFIEVVSKGQLTLKEEEEELTDIHHDRTLKLKHCELSLDSFWISVENEYTTIAQKALKILLLFSTTYLCEQGFSALTTIKNNKRERLLSVEEELRVCLSTIRPRIKEICKCNQAQVSH